jgi:transglutaminase-like putative cysteine protease
LVSAATPPLVWIPPPPTNDTLISTDHIGVAWGRDFGDVSPLRGIILGGGRHSLAVDVRVEHLNASGSAS